MKGGTCRSKRASRRRPAGVKPMIVLRVQSTRLESTWSKANRRLPQWPIWVRSEAGRASRVPMVQLFLMALSLRLMVQGWGQRSQLQTNIVTWYRVTPSLKKLTTKSVRTVTSSKKTKKYDPKAAQVACRSIAMSAERLCDSSTLMRDEWL